MPLREVRQKFEILPVNDPARHHDVLSGEAAVAVAAIRLNLKLVKASLLRLATNHCLDAKGIRQKN